MFLQCFPSFWSKARRHSLLTRASPCVCRGCPECLVSHRPGLASAGPGYCPSTPLICPIDHATCPQVRGDAEALRADNLALAERLKFVQVFNYCKLAAQCLLEMLSVLCGCAEQLKFVQACGSTAA